MAGAKAAPPPGRRHGDSITVRALAYTDRPWLATLISSSWDLPVVSISGAHDPTQLPGLVAEDGGAALGALTYRVGPGEVEIVTLNSAVEDRGVGSAVLAECCRLAEAADARLWLITTDDNLRAIAFYQRRGMEMVASHRDFVDTVRRSKPMPSTPGADGFPFRHAVEFEYAAHRRHRSDA